MNLNKSPGNKSFILATKFKCYKNLNITCTDARFVQADVLDITSFLEHLNLCKLSEAHRILTLQFLRFCNVLKSKNLASIQTLKATQNFNNRKIADVIVPYLCITQARREKQ